jgi:hypothetical protein
MSCKVISVQFARSSAEFNNDSNHTRILTAKQHIKYIPNIDPLGQTKSKSGIERLEEFVNDPAINALSIALDEKGTMVLYEDVK